VGETAFRAAAGVRGSVGRPDRHELLGISLNGEFGGRRSAAPEDGAGAARIAGQGKAGNLD